ncbi:MAG: TrbI/VirB10 family protein [Blastocatellia bacterium]
MSAIRAKHNGAPPSPSEPIEAGPLEETPADEQDPFEKIRNDLASAQTENEWKTPPQPVPFDSTGTGDDPNAQREVPREGTDPQQLEKPLEPQAAKAETRFLNRRVAIGAVIVLIILEVLYLAPGSPKSSPQPIRTGDSSSPLSMDGDKHSQLNAGNDDNTLGTPERQYQPSPQEPSEPAPSPEPSPSPTPTPPSVQIQAPAPAKDVNDFAVALRAGERQTKLSEKQDALADVQALTKPSPQETSQRTSEASFQSLPDGTRMSLQLKEPFRSGIASSISAQVVEDSLGPDKRVLIPRGSTATIAFLPYEVNQRILNDQRAPVLVVTPEGKKYRAVGVIKGTDGFAGLTGRVKTIGRPSVLHRIGTTAVGTAGRVGAGQIGTYSPDVEDEINREEYQYGSGATFDRSSRVVEIPANTRCSLIVTAEAAK